MSSIRTVKYAGDALETMERIMGDIITYMPNKTYYNNKCNIYWYINQNGYLHVLQPCITSINKKFVYFSIRDSLLTKDNMLSEIFVQGNFTSKKDCIAAIMENIFNEGND